MRTRSVAGVSVTIALALLAAAIAAAWPACTTTEEPPAPTPPPAPTAAPTPTATAVPTPTATPTPTPTPAPIATSTPTSTPTPIPTPSPLLSFIDGVRLIGDAPDAASAIASLRWVQDGVDSAEAERINRLIALALDDPVLASAVVSLGFVQSGQRRAETEAMDLLLRLAAWTPGVARNITSLEWAQGAMTTQQERVFTNLLRLARLSARAGDALASYAWVRDGVGQAEAWAIRSVSTIRDPEDAAFVATLPWLAEDVNDSATEALDNIVLLVRLHPDDGAKALIAWVRDGVTEEEAAALDRLAGISQEDQAVATTLLALAWVQDGVDATEEQVLRRMNSMLRFRFASSPWRPAEVIHALPWLRDGMTVAEMDALEHIWRIGRADQSAGERVVGMPFLQTFTPTNIRALEALAGMWYWSRDVFQAVLECPAFSVGITDETAPIVSALGNLAGSDKGAQALAILDSPALQGDVSDHMVPAIESLVILARDHPDIALAILHSPALSNGITDDMVPVIQALAVLASPHPDLALAILHSPALQGAITDDILTIITLLGAVASNNPALIPTLLDPTKTSVERRTITTPLAVEVELAIVRTRPGAANRMDYLEHAVRTAEDLVGAPFPVQAVILFYEDLGFGGANFGTFINILPAGDVADEIGGSIMHEVAHYYKLHGEGWITEGVANAVAAVALERLSGRPLDLWEAPCPYARTIAEFETLDAEYGTLAFICHYALGERIFMDLYRSLGEERFRQGLRNLFLGAQDTGYEGPLRGIRHVAEAFGADDEVVQTIIARWYDGSAPYDTSRLDASPVDPDLPAVNGRVADAYVAVDGGGSPAATFTAGAYERLVLVLESGDNAREPLDLEVVEYYEDGFAFARHTLTLDASPHTTGATGRVYLRKGGADAAPGTYYVYVYDGDRKVAEVQYTVTA